MWMRLKALDLGLIAPCIAKPEPNFCCRMGTLVHYPFVRKRLSVKKSHLALAVVQYLQTRRRRVVDASGRARDTTTLRLPDLTATISQEFSRSSNRQ